MEIAIDDLTKSIELPKELRTGKKIRKKKIKNSVLKDSKELKELITETIKAFKIV